MLFDPTKGENFLFIQLMLALHSNAYGKRYSSVERLDDLEIGFFNTIVKAERLLSLTRLRLKLVHRSMALLLFA
jgi:hypothetical protein